jgi:hypothetical protein
MAATIRTVEYFNTFVHDRPGEAYKMLTQLAKEGVNLLAFSAIPIGPNHTQLVLFPEEPGALVRAAENTGMVMTGPQHALLVQGDDELGALVEIHRQLYDARVNIYASTGVTDGKGRFGYVLYVRDADFEKAGNALDL